MTTPAPPATGPGTPGTGDPSPQPTDPANTPGQQPATGAGQGDDWATAFEGLTPAEVKAKLDHARTWEKRAKDNKKALDDALAKGKPKDGEVTVEQLQQQLTDATTAREAAETAALEASYTSTVTRVASKVGADAEALLDSDRFRKAVGEELGDDFDDSDLRAAVEKVAKQFAKQARFSSRPTPARGSGEFDGAPGGTNPITEEQLAKMTPAEITAAYNAGKLKHLM